MGKKRQVTGFTIEEVDGGPPRAKWGDHFIPPEKLLDVARRIIERKGEAQAMVFLEQDDDALGVPVDRHPVETLEAVAYLIEEGQLQRPKWAQVISDSYRTIVKTEAEVAKVAQGSLHERFTAGDPNVVECLMVWSVEEGKAQYDSQSYLRLKDKIVWEDVETNDDYENISGNVPSALAKLVTP